MERLSLQFMQEFLKNAKKPALLDKDPYWPKVHTLTLKGTAFACFSILEWWDYPFQGITISCDVAVQITVSFSSKTTASLNTMFLPALMHLPSARKRP